jgi:hypothetical protein
MGIGPTGTGRKTLRSGMAHTRGGVTAVPLSKASQSGSGTLGGEGGACASSEAASVRTNRRMRCVDYSAVVMPSESKPFHDAKTNQQA